MTDDFYTKQIKCPICNNVFLGIKVKSKACIVVKKDEDFCTYYKDINPLFYEIHICPSCAYAAYESSFQDISQDEVLKLRDAFCAREVSRNFCKERSLNDALDSFKLALYTANIMKAKNSSIASLCLKIAWMYRYLEDKNEIKFLQYALDNYLVTYEKERLPIGGLSQIKLTYLIGELHRRLGNYNEAVNWFSKVVASPERNANRGIERLAREQWMTLRDEIKKKTAQ